MGTPSARRTEDVTVLRDGLLQGDGARQFAALSLAEATHLPTGVASGRSEAVTIAAGMELDGGSGDGPAQLLHVVAGLATIVWGDAPQRSVSAGPGETVLVPAGVPFRARNASPVASLHVVRVRGE